MARADGRTRPDGLVLGAEMLTATEWGSSLIRDRRLRVNDWKGQERVSSETEVVKSLQVGKAPFGELPSAASKGLSRPDSVGRTPYHIRDLGPDPKPTTSQLRVSFRVLS